LTRKGKDQTQEKRIVALIPQSGTKTFRERGTLWHKTRRKRGPPPGGRGESRVWGDPERKNRPKKIIKRKQGTYPFELTQPDAFLKKNRGKFNNKGGGKQEETGGGVQLKRSTKRVCGKVGSWSPRKRQVGRGASRKKKKPTASERGDQEGGGKIL